MPVDVREEILDALGVLTSALPVVELGCQAHEVLHVGDNLDADVGGAATLGMRTAWLTRRVADPAAARSSHGGPLPDFTLADLAELPALLDRLA